MKKQRTFALMLCLVLSGAWSYAHGVVGMGKNRIGEIPIELIKGICHSSSEKGDAIVASIDGHTLSVVFLENLGQVTIDVSLVGGGEVETQSTPTPNGVIIYIPDTGSYIVTFTLSNGDAYYGEFEVTD